ncbi:unnamed protein product, partial [Symbiodinium pilosum]
CSLRCRAQRAQEKDGLHGASLWRFLGVSPGETGVSSILPAGSLPPAGDRYWRRCCDGVSRSDVRRFRSQGDLLDPGHYVT